MWMFENSNYSSKEKVVLKNDFKRVLLRLKHCRRKGGVK